MGRRLVLETWSLCFTPVDVIVAKSGLGRYLHFLEYFLQKGLKDISKCSFQLLYRVIFRVGEKAGFPFPPIQY